LPGPAAPNKGRIGLAHDGSALFIQRRCELCPFPHEPTCQRIESGVAAAAHGDTMRDAAARLHGNLHGKRALIPAPRIVGVGGTAANPPGGL
jgi:hypothetical protein